jgi:histidinol-phosphate aminotransferase
VIRRLRDYYRQFEELSPAEMSRELLDRRDAERARALTEVPALDLATAAWHEPPHPEAVNAATYALRRAVNAYPDSGPLREAIAERHGVEPAQVALGHGAGELLRAAFGAPGGGEVAVAWPAWGPLPRLVHEAGGVPVPVALTDRGTPDPDALLAAADARAVVLCNPNDPTGAALEPSELHDLARRLPESVWLIVDAALAEFQAGASGAGVASVLELRERVVVVRSFSKAHGMAGLRAGYALAADAGLAERLAPSGGMGAPAQAAALWAVGSGDPVVARRRAVAAAERERLAAGLDGTGFRFPDGPAHLVWLSSAGHDGRTLASRLAAQRIYVTPGAAWGDDRHVRIALRDRAATERLIDALRDL